MMGSDWRWLCAALLIACLACFAWAMRKFFTKPAGETGGMKIIQLCGSIAAVAQFFGLLAARDIPADRGLLAVALYIAALGLFWRTLQAASRATFSAAFSPDTPAALVDQGPYRFVRHPFYTSYMLVWLAAPIATGRWYLVPTLIMMLAIYLRAAAVEEQKFAASPLADAYDAYRFRTGSFIPNPVKLARTFRREITEQNATGLAQPRA